jgi:hypothetical protein
MRWQSRSKRKEIEAMEQRREERETREKKKKKKRHSGQQLQGGKTSRNTARTRNGS